MDAVDERGWTSLHFAASKGDTDAIAELLLREANVDAATVDGASPLYIASRNGHTAVVGELLSRGAEHGHIDVLGQLLDRSLKHDRAHASHLQSSVAAIPSLRNLDAKNLRDQDADQSYN